MVFHINKINSDYAFKHHCIHFRQLMPQIKKDDSHIIFYLESVLNNLV